MIGGKDWYLKGNIDDWRKRLVLER